MHFSAFMLIVIKDNLQSRSVIEDFASEFSCHLTISENSEHPFMDESDGIIVTTWINNNI